MVSSSYLARVRSCDADRDRFNRRLFIADADRAHGPGERQRRGHLDRRRQ